jgi:hypothetical protein
LDQEDQYLHAITKQISTAVASDPPVQGPEATQATTSGTEMGTSAPPPPQTDPASASPAWSSFESDEEDASGFTVEPSKAISTSPPDPTSPPQQD